MKIDAAPREKTPASVAALVFALQQEQEAGRIARRDCLFKALIAEMDKTIGCATAHYRDSFGSEHELLQVAHKELFESAMAYLPEHAARANCPFGGFFRLRLRKALSRAYYENRSQFGEREKVQRLVRYWRGEAAKAGVDTRDGQAVLDYALKCGARRSILSRYQHLLGGGTLSLDAPLTNADGDSGATLGHFLADESASDAPDEAHENLKRLVWCGLKALNAHQRTIVERLFGLSGRSPETVAEIARDLRVSACSVAECRDRAFANLRKCAKGGSAENIVDFPVRPSSPRRAA